MEKLIALPIKGESFLLHRNDRYVLVDGGYNSRELSAALKRHAPDMTRINVIVCTHADRDHAGGLADLLDKLDLPVDEFWLPGTWYETLPALLEHPESVIDTLLLELDDLPDNAIPPNIESDDIEGITRHIELRAAQERNAARRAHLQSESRQRETSLAEDDAPQTRQEDLLQLTKFRHAIDSIGDSGRNAAQGFEKGRRSVRYRRSKQKVDPRAAQYWLSLIDTAQSIRAIAVQAIRHNVRIRWFDFSEFSRTRTARGGDTGFLEPLNSVELMSPPQPSLKLSYLARLSPVNEECLAFVAPPDFLRLGVIFSGDSPFGDGPQYATSFLTNASRPEFPVVVTAPHHGSENNCAAYGHIHSWADVALWVRAGGSIRQPGKTYKSLYPTERVCTHCPQKGLARQKATIGLDTIWWLRRWPWHGPLLRVSAHDCDCK